MSYSPWIRVAVLMAAVLLAGCAAPAPPAAAPVAPLPVAELPVLSYFTVAMSPLIDGYAARTGQIAQPRSEKIPVFDAAGGRPLALLPSAESVPVVGRAEGWVRVMLPSRRMWPSAKPAGGVVVSGGESEDSVNGGTGWVKESDVDIKKEMARIAISRADRRLYLVSHAGNRFASYPATIGSDVPNGPTYVSSGSGVAGGCVDTPPVQLSVQSETADGFCGQSVFPIFIAGPDSQCNYTTEDMSDAARGMVQLSPSDAKSLAAFLIPGMEVDIVSGKPAGSTDS